MILKWIEDWYTAQCDGNWEHEHTFIIESLDNPGWSVEIDFNNTNHQSVDRPWKLYENSNND